MSLDDEIAGEGLEKRHFLVAEGEEKQYGGPYKDYCKFEMVGGEKLLLGISPEGRFVYSRKDNSMAYGPPKKSVLGFTELNGRWYLRAETIEEQMGLFDSDGNLFKDEKYDGIEILHKTPQGKVVEVTKGEKKAIVFQDGSVAGRCDEKGIDNSMHDSVRLVKIGDDVCLLGDDDGSECLYNIKTGEEIYGGVHPKIEKYPAGTILAREMNGTMYVKVRNDAGDAAVVSRDGFIGFGAYHLKEVGEDDPNNPAGGLEIVDGVAVMKFEIDDEGRIECHKEDGAVAFGGVHDSYSGLEDDIILKFEIEGQAAPATKTLKKFSTGEDFCYYDIEGLCGYDGTFISQFDRINWHGTPILGLEKAGRKRYKKPDGQSVFGEFHDETHGVYRINCEIMEEQPPIEHKAEGEEAERATPIPKVSNLDILVLKAFDRDALGVGRKIAGIFSTQFTWYDEKGSMYTSEKKLRAHFRIPYDVAFTPFVSTDTIVMRIPDGAPISPDVQALLDQKKAQLEAEDTAAKGSNEEVLPIAEPEAEEPAQEDSDTQPSPEKEAQPEVSEENGLDPEFPGWMGGEGGEPPKEESS